MEKNNIYNFSDKKSQTSYIKHETYPDLYFVGPQFLGNNFENKIADILSVTGLDHIDEQSYRTLAISHPYYIQTTRQLTMNIDIEDTYSDEYNEGLPNPLLNIGTSEKTRQGARDKAGHRNHVPKCIPRANGPDRPRR